MLLPWLNNLGMGGSPTVGVAYTTVGVVPFLYTADNWGNVSFHLEAALRATAGTAYARLYNITDGVPVPGSSISTSSATYTRQRSGDIAAALVDGKEYLPQSGKGGSDSGWICGPVLVVV